VSQGKPIPQEDTLYSVESLAENELTRTLIGGENLKKAKEKTNAYARLLKERGIEYVPILPTLRRKGAEHPLVHALSFNSLEPREYWWQGRLTKVGSAINAQYLREPNKTVEIIHRRIITATQQLSTYGPQMQSCA